MNIPNVTKIKESKLELFKEGLKLFWPVLFVFIIIYVFMLWHFREYSSIYLFNWLTFTFCIVIAAIQVRYREYYRRLNTVWGWDPKYWVIQPIFFILFGIYWLIMGIINYSHFH